MYLTNATNDYDNHTSSIYIDLITSLLIMIIQHCVIVQTMITKKITLR